MNLTGALKLDELVRKLADDLAERYARGESPRVEDYLHTFPELRTAQECLITLICAEWTVRSRHGESPTLAEISLRFGPLHLAVLRRLGLDAPPTPAVQAASSLADDPYRTAPPTSPGQPFPAAFGLPTQIGPYRIVREIGRGGMGVVYEAEDLEGKSRVALKTLPLDRQGSLLRFKNEFRSLQNVINEHLVRMLSLDTSTVQPFFTMELIEGTTFLNYVRGGFDSQRPEAAVEFDERRLRHAMQQLASAVQALHDAGKLHRDIKPSNVMVRRGDERVVLLDFGLAVSLSPSADYRTAQVAGTPRYMAPEQRMGQGSPASDWYSVGVMLYEALTGNVPGEAEPQAAPAAPAALPPAGSSTSIPEDLATLCAALLRRSPADRPSGAEIIRRLDADRREQAPRQIWAGRRRELEQLRAAAERVRGGEPFAQFIHGVSGIGKTALVERFLAELAAQPGVLVFRGRCFEGESVPYNAFDGAMDGMADYLARCKEGLVERLLPMDIADLCRMFPVFGEVGPCQRLLQGSKSGGTEQESRQRAVAALREMLGRMVRFGSALVVLFLDDVQRCDQDSAELFEGLMRLPQAPPVLVLAAFRRDDVAASRFLPGLLKVDQPAEQRRAFAEQAEIALEGLSAEEVAELAASHGQAARAGEITRESGGVPIFIDYLLEPGAAAPSAPSAPEPFSLAVVLGQRIERLPPDQQRLLQIVAIGGRPVAESLALRAAGLGGSAVAAAPDLRRQRFLRTLAENEEPLIETYHDRLRDAVLRSLSAEEVRAGSAALAEALESGRGRDAEWLAELWARAGQKEKAGEYSYLAAERAQESMAFANAARLYQRGLEWAPRSGSKEAELRVRLADALAHAGRSREAAAEYLRAATLCEASQAADLRCRGALRYLTSGHLSEGLAALTGVLREAGLSYPARRFTAIAALLYEQARLALRGLTPRTAIAGEIEPSARMHMNVTWSAAAGLSLIAPLQAAIFVSRNLRLALDADSPRDLIRALTSRIGHLAIGGRRSRRSVARHLRALRNAAARYGLDESQPSAPFADAASRWSSQHPYAKATRDMARGVAEHLLGNWSAGQRCCDRAAAYLQDRRCRDVNWELDTARTFSMWCLMYQGNMAELARRQPKLIGLAQENDDLFAVLNFGTVIMTAVLLAGDDTAEARRRLEADRARLTPGHFFVQHHNWLLASACLELYDGEAQAAWRVIADGWQNYTSSLLSYVQQVRIDFLGTCGRAALAAAAGSRDRAILARARAIARRLEGENARWAGALALMLRGGLANLADDRRAAGDYLSRAVESFQAIPMHLYAAAVRWQLGRLQGAAAGAGLCQEAEHEMRVLGIRNPVRMANALVTGFGTNASAGDAGYSPRPGRGDVAGNSEQNTDY